MDDDIHNLTEADRTSQTRFGPRPVPEGHRTASPYAHRPMRSSRVIPSAPMSPDGKSAYPAPSLSSKIIVWGGVAAGVAGLTAAALITARKLTVPDGSEGRSAAARQDYRRNDQALAPRFAEMDENEREEMRRRVRARARQDSAEAARGRAIAGKGRGRSSGNIARDLTDTANDLSGSIHGVAQSMVSAFQGFRSVASQATGIVGEFAAAAEQMRTLLRSGADLNSAADKRRQEPARDDQEDRL